MIKKIRKYTLITTIILILALTTTYIFTKNINFSLNGENNTTIPLNKSYNDPGAHATIFKLNINKNIKTYSNLDTSKIGKYNITYNLSFLNHTYTLNRQIEVVDPTPPTIKLNGDETIRLCIGDNYIEKGAIAYNNQNKDLSNLIKIEGSVDTTKEGIYELNYYVTDVLGNISSTKRIIKVEDPISKYIKENNYNVSIGYYNLVTKKQYLYNENEIYYGASLIKTLDAIYLYDKGLVNETIKPYIKKAISISDNDAHYYLVNYIGKENLKKYGISLGAPNTLSNDTYYHENTYYGNTTVKDQLVYLKKLYTITKNNEELKSFFINDYGNYIKVNNLTVMHKYGYLDQYYHDEGIIFDTNPYIIIILTNHGNDNKKEIINNLSNLLYKYHLNQL